MARKYVFADEAGDFTFINENNISKYFIVCTVSMPSCNIGETLLELRRAMAWKRMPLGDHFHATDDNLNTRSLVYQLIERETLRIDAIILDKRKAQPQTRVTDDRFYKTAWYYHFKYTAPYIAMPGDELLVTAATLGTKKTRTAFTEAVKDVVSQVASHVSCVTAFWPAQSDPCLQIADYCTWAIQRKWERQDTGAYDLIKKHIRTEYDLWQTGTQTYY